jgi:hypothetical protein
VRAPAATDAGVAGVGEVAGVVGAAVVGVGAGDVVAGGVVAVGDAPASERDTGSGENCMGAASCAPAAIGSVATNASIAIP